MSIVQLLIRNLFYHWRGNLAVFLGIVLGSAVLTGALLVGDSLRGSLKALTLDQLGWVEEAMVPGRFFREQLVTEISADRRAAALLLQGSASRKSDNGDSPRVGKVTLLGVDASFWPGEHLPIGADFWASDVREVVVNETLARALEVKPGDTISIHLQKPEDVPREQLLGKRKDVIATLTLKIRAVLPDVGMARLSLKPTPEAVRNAFVPIRALQKHRELGLAGQANALLVSQAKPSLQADLQKQLKLEDWGLLTRSPRDRAEALVRFLDPKNFDGGNLKRPRWEGGV